ncbi:MAG: hypothetical protein H6623_05140 [Bdellovibrionaceae bacterium]|nr:hypothetical protein [Pseudobdellovibrionaceae bacterium]
MWAAQSDSLDEPAATPTVVTTASSTPPKLRATFSSYYYSFEGRRAAITNLYEFGKITSRLDFFNMNYALPNNWSLNLLLQHYDSYIETRFPFIKDDPTLDHSNDRIEGLSDSYLTVVAPITMSFPIMVTADFGVSIPTGSIAVKSHLPKFETVNLAYNAQLGSGTYDALAGFTVLYIKTQYQLGSRFLANIRTGRNSFDYRLGNQYRLDGWFDYNLPHGFTPRLVGYYRFKDAIVGFDRTRGRLPGDNYFYHKQANWDISLALRYTKQVPSTSLAFNGEVGVPIAQNTINVDHSFVKTLFYVNLGLNAAF